MAKALFLLRYNARMAHSMPGPNAGPSNYCHRTTVIFLPHCFAGLSRHLHTGHFRMPLVAQTAE